MSYFLENHFRQINLSFKDCFFSIFTGLSGFPYAKRHLELSQELHCKHTRGHRIIAFLEMIPLFGGALALIEGISGIVARKISLHFLKNRVRVEKNSSDAIEKMWKNSKKAILEHREKSPDEPYIHSDDMTPIQALFRCCKKTDFFQIVSKTAKHQGRRKYMQDDSFYKEIEQGYLLGVLDGHGKHGDQVSLYSSIKFPEVFPKILKEQKYNIRSAFQKTIDVIHSKITPVDKWTTSGTTAVVCFIDKYNDLIYTATLGDSEAHLYRKIHGVFRSIPLSCVRDWNSEKDAKRVNFRWPTQEKKKRRFPFPRDGINVSRCIGDKKYMQTSERPGVIQKPKITIHRIKEGDILVMGSDGFKDFVSEKEVISHLGQDLLAKRLADFAFNEKKSNDNITVLAAKISRV